MLEYLAIEIAVVYFAVGLTYGIICHFTAKSQRLRASCLGGFMWPFTGYIERLYDNNFVAKNSGRNFIILLMTVFGGVKLLRDIVILIRTIFLLTFFALLTAFLIFWDWIEKRPKFDGAEIKTLMKQ